jgi:polyisoprenoid-binding protein YceI
MLLLCEVHRAVDRVTRCVVRSPFAPVVLPVIALLGSLARWKMQGSGNLYTAFAKRFFIADPDLGWRPSPAHPVWIGLEACALMAAIAAGLIVAGWFIRRREAKTGQRATLLRLATWIVGLAPLVLPVWAFASGPAPAGAKDTLPASTLAGIESGIAGSIDAAEGTYEVVEHAGTSITAHLSAGHETFDARFASGIKGSWQGDPRDFNQPIAGKITVAAAGVDTGIGERSKHAREEYLKAAQFPQISVSLDRVLAAKQAGNNTVAFRAHGTLELMGKTQDVEISGTLRKPDAAALGRLGLTGATGDVLLAQAEFSLVIKDSALAGDAGDFDGDKIPLQISLVLRHAGG